MSSRMLQFILFADDSNIFLSHPDPEQLTQMFNDELKNVSNWIKANKLSLNLDKTSYMLFSNKITTVPNDIILNDSVIQRVRSIKFLGLVIDEKLSWKAHIDNICKIIARNIGVMSKLSHFLPHYIMLSLYSTLILPYLNYGLVAWGNAATSQINRLCILQKKAIRIINNAEFRAHTNNLFLKNKVLKIKDLYIFQLGQLMYKLINQQLPLPFNDMFVKNDSIHKHFTRQASSFHLPLNRTSFAQKTFVFTGPKLWNSLSNDIIQCNSIQIFKGRLKSFLLNTY